MTEFQATPKVPSVIGVPRVWNQPEGQEVSPEEESMYRSIIEALPYIAWVAGPDGSPLYFNSTAYQFSGMDPGVPYDTRDLVHPEDLERVVTARDNAARLGEPLNIELRLRRHDGEYRWHRTYVGPLKGPVGAVLRYLGTSIDLHNERRAQEELLALNAELDLRVHDRTSELRRSNVELEAFTYHVAHDLRAPLRAIVGNARILEEDFGDELPAGARQLIERQVSAANKLGILVDELLKLSRLAREEVETQEINLSLIASDVASEHASENEKVTIDVQPDMTAEADPRLVRLLLSNLISNALRYSPNGGRVLIGCESAEAEDVFFVRDEGIGFDMKYCDKLFQPFERLVSDAEFPGTGVGLANVARIVSRHRGKVWAQAAPGQGATFFFTFG